MALRDTAIVGYAETKIVEKSDRDVWELGAEILETLLDKTGFEKGEIDGLILSSSMTGAGNCFWSQTTADQLALELDFCQTVDIGGCSPLGARRARRGGDRCRPVHARCCASSPIPSPPRTTGACARSTTSGRRRSAISARPRPSACSAGATSTSSASTTPRSASSPWRSAATPCSTSWPWRSCASRSRSTTTSTRA